VKLYDYYRSTAAYRVRIALNLKKITYETIAIHLLNQGGEQHSLSYQTINPQKRIPTIDDNGQLLSQSLAILEYLEETHPTPSLLPITAIGRAQVRRIAMIISCDMHPLNNLGTLQTLTKIFNASESDIQQWYHHWLKIGFDAIEALLSTLPRQKEFCFGSQVSFADICLIPQIYNAYRFKFAMDDYPQINTINQHCLSIEEFQKALPKES
jgi:maleylacetoacetate isomerase